MRNSVERKDDASHVEIYRDRTDGYRWRLKVANSETIASSEGYTTKASCKNGVDSVKRNAPDAEVVDLTDE